MSRKVTLATIFLMLLLLPAGAQKMKIEKFKRVKFDLLNHSLLPVDKKQATLDLMTDETGFEVKADGKTDVKVEAGEGKLTLLAPHKTKFLVIKHPDYGQFTWKVPGKGLRKKKHYQANLWTDKPGKEYKLSKQWVVFRVEPENAILQVDSNVVLLRDGLAQMNLPLGKHPYRVEAPFHKEQSDTLELTDSAKLYKTVSLQSFYSYVTVRTPMSDGIIFLDGQQIGKGEATSGHLQEGMHHLLVAKGQTNFYETYVNVGNAEKRVIELTADDLQPKQMNLKRCVIVSDTILAQKTDSVNQTQTDKQSLAKAHVIITAPNDSTEIWLNQEFVAIGKWEGELELGYYIVNTQKDGLMSATVPLWVDDNLPVLLDMSAPMASYGLLNIHSNVVGATIFINKIKVGMTPFVVTHLPADKPCKVRLTSEGYRDAEAVVVPIGNDMVDVNMKMKRL